ncbi:hypothetical protein TNCV_218821 [Trichonephila clavipes]|uniref:Uncharacterized protein n=1 Tax=Trichonephila clavipes TaxID=2585209 RepID=A0A8X6S6E9_TRICX|nr:hypothetical protein TNCV_218821 [Trichonephila clavipes]
MGIYREKEWTESLPIHGVGTVEVPTPVSPLPPTPVASLSHEPSQDVIYDSLQPIEQSTVSESPLKDPVDSKPPVVSKQPIVFKSSIVSKSPDSPVKKVDSVIHRSPRSRERRNDERRPRDHRAHFNDCDAHDAARETRRIGKCSSAGPSPCLHHLPGTQHETCFSLVLLRQLLPNQTLVDNFKRAMMEVKHEKEFRPDNMLWEKFSKRLLRKPDRP